MQATSSYRSRADRISITASFICAVHCIALPLFFSTVPFVGIEILHNPFIEAATIMVSMGIGSWAIWRGYRLYHRSKMILWSFLLGLLCMIGGNFTSGRSLEIIMKLTGGIMVVTAHIRNWKRSRQCVVHSHKSENIGTATSVKEFVS